MPLPSVDVEWKAWTLTSPEPPSPPSLKRGSRHRSTCGGTADRVSGGRRVLSQPWRCCYCRLGEAARFLHTKQPGHTTVQCETSSFIMWLQLQELQDFRGRHPRGAGDRSTTWAGKGIPSYLPL